MKITERQNNFNLMRLILALLVILSHSSEIVDNHRRRELLSIVFGTLSFGDLAVDCFFILSGYLIMQSWHNQPQAWPFLRKRLLRIYPGFIMATLICVFIVGPLAADRNLYFEQLSLLDMLGNMMLLQKPAVPPVFIGLGHPGINNSMWSISYEFACYLSILCLGIIGALRRSHIWLKLTIFVFILAVVEKLFGSSTQQLRVAMLFLSGGSYYIYRSHMNFTGKNVFIATTLLALFMLYWRTAEIAVASIGGYILVYLANKQSKFLSRFNNLPDISYGTYLYGWPIQKLFLWYLPTLSPWSLFALSAPSALLAGTISWYLIEKPMLRFKGPTLSVPHKHDEQLAS